MAIDVNYVLERLSTQQIESGGYYGTDITKLSKELAVTPKVMFLRISRPIVLVKDCKTYPHPHSTGRGNKQTCISSYLRQNTPGLR
jgi:hypothetical protein